LLILIMVDNVLLQAPRWVLQGIQSKSGGANSGFGKAGALAYLGGPREL